MPIKKKARTSPGKKVEAFMDKNNLTTREMGKLMGVSFGAVSHWKVGRKPMSETAAKLLDVYIKYPIVFKAAKKKLPPEG